MPAVKPRKRTFPEYLWQRLNDESHQDGLRWMPCGTQFTITNYHKFTSDAMIALFQIHHMSSFVRKLNRWGFTREFVAGNLDVFRHHLFQCDRPCCSACVMWCHSASPWSKLLLLLLLLLQRHPKVPCDHRRRRRRRRRSTTRKVKSAAAHAITGQHSSSNNNNNK